jgi:hypothetical protein
LKEKKVDKEKFGRSEDNPDNFSHFPQLSFLLTCSMRRRCLLFLLLTLTTATARAASVTSPPPPPSTLPNLTSAPQQDARRLNKRSGGKAVFAHVVQGDFQVRRLFPQPFLLVAVAPSPFPLIDARPPQNYSQDDYEADMLLAKEAGIAALFVDPFSSLSLPSLY